MPATISTALRPSRPVINIGGQDNANLTGGLLYLTIIENMNELYRCEALFGNWGNNNGGTGYLYFDRNLIDFGKEFKVRFDNNIFDGKIMGIEANYPAGGPPQVSILADDRFQDMRMTRRTRTFCDLSDVDVIRRIAGEHGLTPEIDITGSTHKLLAQLNQSDMAFLRDRARLNGAVLWMEGNTLHVTSPKNNRNQALRMTYGVELREFTVTADLANQRTGIKVCGWDSSSKQAISYEANDTVIQLQLDGDISGASILSSVFGKRKDTFVHTVPFSNKEAEDEANGRFRETARHFVVGRGIAETDSRLKCGTSIELQGLGDLFNGYYLMTEVKHIFDIKRGIRTEFKAERPGIGKPT